MSDVGLVLVHAKGDRSAFLEVPVGVLPLPDALLCAAAFLIEGLDGAPLDAVARAVAQLVASASPASSADAVVRARIVTGGVAVTSAEVPWGFALPVEDAVFGAVNVVDECDDFGVYLLRVGAGKSIPTHEHRRMDEWEFAYAGELALQGVPIETGQAVRWPLRFPHRWDNRGANEAVVLCIDRPRFDASDEILIDATFLDPCPTRFCPTLPR